MCLLDLLPRLSRPFAAASMLCAALLSGLVAGPVYALDESDELQLGNWRVTGATPIDGQTVELSLTASLTNVGSGEWTNAVATSDFIPGYAEVIDNRLDFGPIPPFATTPANDDIVVQLPRGAIGALVQQLRAGTVPFNVNGYDTLEFSVPVAFVDRDTDLVFLLGEPVGDNFVLEFTASTPLLESLAPGMVFMEDITPGGYHVVEIPSSLLPGEVVDVRESGNSTLVELAPVNLFDVLGSGTINAGVDFTPGIESTIGKDTYLTLMNGCVDETHEPDDGGLEEPVACTYAALPIRFNDVDFGAGVTVSGEILLRASGINLEVRLRDGELHRIATRMTFGYVINAQVKATGDAAIAAQEQRLWGLTLPAYTVLLGGFPITIAPDLDLYLGAEANLTAGTVFSVSQATEVGVEIGWNDGQYFAEPIAEAEPITFATPTLTSDTGANAKVWAALDAGLTINGAAGPYLRASLFGDLFVSPVNDPWWVLGGGLEQSAGFQISLLGIDLANWEAPIDLQRLGNLTGVRPPVDAHTMSPTAPTSGTNVRWAQALTTGPGTGAVENTTVAPLADGATVIAGNRATAGFLTKVLASGDVAWEKELDGIEPVRVVELDDGGLMVAANGQNDSWLMRHDAAGNREWTVSHDVATKCFVFDMAVFEDDLGHPAYLMVGRDTDGPITNRDPCAYRLDHTGSVVWANTYASSGADWVEAVTATSDGHFVMVGNTEHDVGTLRSQNALAMKIDPHGALLWATAFGSKASSEFESVTELENGTLIAVGGLLGTVVDLYPALWVVNIEPQYGGAIANVMLAQDYEWEVFIDSTSDATMPGWVPTSGGNTPHDLAHSVTAVPGGVVLAGSTGLGDGTAMWVASLNPSLGVNWMTTYDGSLGDELHAAIWMDDGLVVAGPSRSFVPLGTGGDDALYVAKLPREGLIDYTAGVSNATSRYLQPLVFRTAGLPDFDGGDFADPVVPFVVTPAVHSLGAAVPQAVTDVASTVTRLTD
ncbi:MAG: hypothetical protein AAGA68_13340 [Pseudomonadota bacterium]